MWIEVVKALLTFAVGLGSGVLLMLIKERRDKKGQLEAEQRQILTELLDTLSDAKRVPRPMVAFMRFGQEPPKPDTRFSDTFVKLRNLLARVTDQELLYRIRAVNIVSDPDWLTEGELLPGELTRLEMEMSEEGVRTVILDDAFSVVSAVLRGEQLPKLEEGSEVERIETAYRGIASSLRPSPEPAHEDQDEETGQDDPSALRARPRARKTRTRR